MKTLSSPRKLALESLLKCERDGKYSNLEVSSLISKNALEPCDRGLYTALVYGVIEKRITLDAIIARFSSKSLDKLDREVLNTLRMGLYQLTFMDRIPEYAVLDESVRLIKAVRLGASAPFVNAVLRSALRNKDSFQEILEGAGESALYAMPEPIIDLWRRGYGEERTTELLRGFSKKPPTTLRVNTLKISSDALFDRLIKSGASVSRHPSARDIIILEEGGVEELSGFEEGLFFVQGTSSYTAVNALRLLPDMRVIDTCACPGGKSFSAAIEMKNRGEIFSFDLHKNKLSLIDKGCERLGIDIISASENNANSPREDLIGSADAVICDAPCSGLGIVAKKPDIKYKDISEIERLPALQLGILESSSRYLKRGGRLLYSTCTLNPLENEGVTDKFLMKNPDFRREGAPVTIFPSRDFEDGFFYDILIKE